MKLMAGWEQRRGGSQLLRIQDRKSGCSSHGCGQEGSRNLKCLGLDVVSHGSGGEGREETHCLLYQEGCSGVWFG
jgi:hypothetical protein